MYRALALKAIDWDTSFEDETALVALAQSAHRTGANDWREPCAAGRA
jgi:hypothetical protein